MTEQTYTYTGGQTVDMPELGLRVQPGETIETAADLSGHPLFTPAAAPKARPAPATTSSIGKE